MTSVDSAPITDIRRSTALGITVYGCEPDEAEVFRRLDRKSVV